MQTVIMAVAVLGILGAVFGLILAHASKVLSLIHISSMDGVGQSRKVTRSMRETASPSK